MNCIAHGLPVDALGSCEACSVHSMNLARLVENERSNIEWFKEAPRYAYKRKMAIKERKAHVTENFVDALPNFIEYLLRPQQAYIIRQMAREPYRYWTYKELGLDLYQGNRVRKRRDRARPALFQPRTELRLIFTEHGRKVAMWLTSADAATTQGQPTEVHA